MTSSISYSALVFTEKDCKEEQDELSEDEKETILDDIYGREECPDNNEENNDETTNHDNNGNGNGNNNDIDLDDDNDLDDYDITNELIHEFHRCLNDIPMEEKKEYVEALEKAPNYVIDVESSPKRFIRAEEYDISMAVLRLVEYWKCRVEVFGPINAFKPITLQGAMRDDIRTLMLFSTYMRILPNDKHGRAVFCADKTKCRYKDLPNHVALVKIVWFIFHEALAPSNNNSNTSDSNSIQRNGFIGIGIDWSTEWDFIPRSTMKLMTRTMDECLPIRIRCIHVLCSSLVVKIVVPVIKFFMTREARQRMQLHTGCSIHNKSAIITTLETYGLQSHNLPTSIGGTYTQKPNWINECNLILKEQERKNRRTSTRRRKRERSVSSTISRGRELL